jgi:hypothetical protein
VPCRCSTRRPVVDPTSRNDSSTPPATRSVIGLHVPASSHGPLRGAHPRRLAAGPPSGGPDGTEPHRLAGGQCHHDRADPQHGDAGEGHRNDQQRRGVEGWQAPASEVYGGRGHLADKHQRPAGQQRGARRQASHLPREPSGCPIAHQASRRGSSRRCVAADLLLHPAARRAHVPHGGPRIESRGMVDPGAGPSFAGSRSPR